MYYSMLKYKIKDLSEQLHVTQNNRQTEVHWIYGGFDVYESLQKNPRIISSKKNPIGRVANHMKEWISDEDSEPMYHVIAEISETREYTVLIDMDPAELPAEMRKKTIPLIASYGATPINERTPRIRATVEPHVESGSERQSSRRKLGSLVKN